MSSARSAVGSRVRAGIALTFLCCAEIVGCGGVEPSGPARALSTLPDAPAPPASAPTASWFVVDTGPIPPGRLAFELEVIPTAPGGTTPYYARIYTMRTDGAGLLALTPAGEIGRAPAWSPDGSRLAYESWHVDAAEIWTVRADGTGRTLVARAASEPFWLDDTHLGFQCGTSLCAIRDDGAERRVLLARDSLPNAADFAYKLSPDRTTIVFTRITYFGPGAPSTYVYVMNADGTGERKLTPDDQGDSPQWSPVGRSVAYASARRGDAVVDADAGAVTLVSRWNGESPFRSIGSPAWSPAGAELVFGNDVRAFYFARADGTGLIRRVRPSLSINAGDNALVNAWAWTSR
jgi:dipeptidyl aminopeptidase/acylaminoacyl peptidase